MEALRHSNWLSGFQALSRRDVEPSSVIGCAIHQGPLGSKFYRGICSDSLTQTFAAAQESAKLGALAPLIARCIKVQFKPYADQRKQSTHLLFTNSFFDEAIGPYRTRRGALSQDHFVALWSSANPQVALGKVICIKSAFSINNYRLDQRRRSHTKFRKCPLDARASSTPSCDFCRNVPDCPVHRDFRPFA